MATSALPGPRPRPPRAPSGCPCAAAPCGLRAARTAQSPRTTRDRPYRASTCFLLVSMGAYGNTSPVTPDEEFELVRKTWAAFSDQDLDGGLVLLHPDVEIVPFGARLDGRSYSGRDGVRRWFEGELKATWERFETIPEDYRKAGDQLVVYGHWSARSHSSGVEISMPATWVIEMRDGLISRWETFTDRDEAHRAAGLAEAE